MFLVLERGHISHTVKMHYFFENVLLYSGAWVRQTKYIHVVMVKMGGSTKIVTFVTFFCARLWPYTCKSYNT